MVKNTSLVNYYLKVNYKVSVDNNSTFLKASNQIVIYGNLDAIFIRRKKLI